MIKKVSIKPKAFPVDQWVATRDSEVSTESSAPALEAKPKMKRLTLDISEALHRAIKKEAADRGVPMADMLRDLLENHYLS